MHYMNHLDIGNFKLHIVIETLCREGNYSTHIMRTIDDIAF